MTSDIQNRDDIQRLIDQFYQKVLKDEVIGHVFTDTIEFIWDRHIPVMYDFWESVLFHTACLLYTSPSPRDQRGSRMPSSA